MGAETASDGLYFIYPVFLYFIKNDLQASVSRI